MAEYRHSGHAVCDIKYHLVWITKYRYKILRGEVAERARDLIRQICHDLSERARKRATELANDADLRLRAPRRFWRADGSVGLEPCPARDPRLPPVGTVLKRVYGERTIEVTVLGTGFEY